jgi:hypothetical protein
MDGGMSIGDTTIFTMPIPEFEYDENLVKELEKSEQENKVEKLNAGNINENIKHPQDLVEKLNNLVLPQYASLIFKSHRNSIL